MALLPLIVLFVSSEREYNRRTQRNLSRLVRRAARNLQLLRPFGIRTSNLVHTNPVHSRPVSALNPAAAASLAQQHCDVIVIRAHPYAYSAKKKKENSLAQDVPLCALDTETRRALSGTHTLRQDPTVPFNLNQSTPIPNRTHSRVTMSPQNCRC